MDQNKSIDVLNTFIHITNNRLKRYAVASEETKDPDLITLFVEFQKKSQRCKAELVSEVQKMGGKPKDRPAVIAPVNRIWIKIKSKFKLHDREDILNRYEYDAAVTLHKFKKVFANNIEHLTSKHQYILKEHHQCIKKDHDTLKGLGDLVAICRKYNIDT